MYGTKRKVIEVTEKQLSSLKTQIARYLRALSAESRGGVISHFGLSITVEGIHVQFSGTTELCIDIEMRDGGGDSGTKAYSKESWLAIRKAVSEGTGAKIIDFSERGNEAIWKEQYELDREVPRSLRFAMESYHRLVDTFDHKGNESKYESKYERFDKWLEERLAAVDSEAIEVKS
jgi:hypothetical protein